MRESKGFTFVETVIVVIIIATLTGTVGVTVNSVNEDARLVNAAVRALADMRYAQEMALTHRREVDFIVNVGTDYYEAIYHSDGSYLPSPQGDGNLIVQLNQDEYQGVQITSSAFPGRQLSFDSVGRPLWNGSPFANEESVMWLNSRISVTIYPAGFSDLVTPSGGGSSGCGRGC
ncbi:hypothetical protein JW824_11635 [bacterium]|nr:hypothetical protein [bacterium]